MYADADDQRRWFKRFVRNDSARIRLLCFHCAGGNAAMFRDWPRLLPASIEPVAVQLPGRLDRFGEPPYQSMELLVDKLADVIKPFLGQPFACYGASMGARVAWTLAHVLRDREMEMPSALYVASNVAPGVDSSGQEWNQPDSRLVEYMLELGGTPPEILADAELADRLVSVLRADLTALATHTFRPASPLAVPIQAFAGSEDAESPPHLMSAWREETVTRFRLDVVPGGHFFSAAGRHQIINVISSDLGLVMPEAPILSTGRNTAVIDFEIHPGSRRVPAVEREAILRSPGFGQVFTDHMVTMRWTAGHDWHDARLEPYGPLALDPATSVFHYAQEFFEGMKAYRQQNGSIALFRPEANAARFNASARRLAMPELAAETFIRTLELLVFQDRDWVPADDGTSLYLRPFMIATQRGLGFTLPSESYLFCVIASPVSAYFGAGARPKPVTVWLSEDYTRAAPGGTGAVKAGANYAQAFAAQQQAAAQGCDQVVWLDAAEHAWVEEMGGMNLFFVYGHEPRIMTPALTGTLLPGITRDALLALAPRLGIGVEEGKISIAQWRERCASGELTEVFACGTAAVISPVGKVRSKDGEWLIGDGDPGPVTLCLREELMGIQYGRSPDPFGWIHKVC